MGYQVGVHVCVQVVGYTGFPKRLYCVNEKPYGDNEKVKLSHDNGMNFKCR